MTNNRKNYRLDVDKIKTLKDVRNVFDSIHFIGYYDADDPNDENYYLSEYFTILEEPPELTFSRPRKSIEEIKQEFDEKIDELIARTSGKFECSKDFAEDRYNTKFDRIIQDFEYAREHGQFMPKVAIGTLSGSYLVSNGGGVEWTQSFVIKQGNKHEGYYTFGNGRYFKYYMPDKPNFVSRFFMDKLLGFKWIDEKNDQ